MANEIKIVVSADDTKAKRTFASLQKTLKVTGAAFTALGVAGLKMVSTSKVMNAALGQTALMLGVSTREMRDLALSVTDVTFPLDSVTKTFAVLSKAGVRNQQDMAKSAKAFDALADATGNSADVVADLLLPAFKLFGVAIPKTSAELDKFTWLTKETLVNLDDFGTLLTRMAPYMDTLDMSMDDAIITLAALSEQGITGTAATLKLRTAITQAASSGKDLSEILGITTAQMEKYRGKMSDAAGMTDEYAKVANTQFTIMDKLKQKWEELSLATSGFLEPLEPILAGMTALGPLMIIASTQGKLFAVVLRGIGVAAHAVLGPIGILTAGIVALAFAGKGLWEAWGAQARWAAAVAKAALEDQKRILEETMAGIKEEIASAKAIRLDAIRVEREAAEAAYQDNIAHIKAVYGENVEAAKSQMELAKEVRDSRIQYLEDAERAAKDTARDEIDRIRELYGEVKVVSKSMIQTAQDERDARITYLDDYIDKARDAHKERLSQLNDEYRAGLDIIQQGYQAQIDAIDAQTDTEDKAIREREVAEREGELRRALAIEGDAEKRKDINEELQAIERKRLLWSRQAEKDALRDKIQAVRDGTDAAAVALKTKIDKEKLTAQQILDGVLKVAAEEKEKAETKLAEDITRLETYRNTAIAEQEKILAGKLETLKKEKEDANTRFKEDITRINDERDAAIEAEGKRLEATQKRLDDETKAMNEEYVERETATAVHVAAINRITEDLKDRVVTITTVHRTITEGGGLSFPGPPVAQGSIPGFQHGGIVTKPTLAMLGERGPEAVVPLNKMGGAGGITVIFQGPVYGMYDFETQVTRAVRDAALAGGFHGVQIGG